MSKGTEKGRETKVDKKSFMTGRYKRANGDESKISAIYVIRVSANPTKRYFLMAKGAITLQSCTRMDMTE